MLAVLKEKKLYKYSKHRIGELEKLHKQTQAVLKQRSPGFSNNPFDAIYITARTWDFSYNKGMILSTSKTVISSILNAYEAINKNNSIRGQLEEDELFYVIAAPIDKILIEQDDNENPKNQQFVLIATKTAIGWVLFKNWYYQEYNSESKAYYPHLLFEEIT